MKKNLLFIFTILLIIVSCTTDRHFENEISNEKSTGIANKVGPPVYDSIVFVDPTKPNINATIITTDQNCYSLASGYGNNYRYYVSAGNTVPYDRVIHSIVIKGTTIYQVSPVTIPANQSVSQDVTIFNNETSRVENVKIRVLSVLNGNVETINDYNKVDFEGYINNCFNEPLNLPDSCYDKDLKPIDENKNGIWDCME
ncbi:hypothetical protein IX39_04435 [Chryseobacterium formosense]|uniref:Lipoprotein n=1 Tax=Chryseobacterium formosense TaxID=236814 RepID=A0A085Z640_9FLAO|nr:hypothetical protein [Chryseobacterium formosense]KFE99903.1 hypothetical protein IX39_04435 [Chryseobacterium formosense]SFT59820.1 hypothetical protein SAMN05421857_1971 [Chryseobacterium formosense]